MTFYTMTVITNHIEKAPIAGLLILVATGHFLTPALEYGRKSEPCTIRIVFDLVHLCYDILRVWL